ncbi:MAG: biopolymer transporter ExbD [Gammaproteobacteria bacterium]|nr:biopolymer transporter ExbD [Gammaproteobacteria bacterium]
MLTSRRAQRMEKHHKRAGRNTGINLVSLMDIFTILVFFLLVNSTDGEVLPSHKSVELPESVSEEIPRQTLVIMLTESDILIHGKIITSIEAILDDDNASALLMSALRDTQTDIRPVTGNTSPVRREATIMGDKQVPYKILKKVMASCTEAGFARISLAVLQKTPEEV